MLIFVLYCFNVRKPLQLDFGLAFQDLIKLGVWPSVNVDVGWTQRSSLWSNNNCIQVDSELFTFSQPGLADFPELFELYREMLTFFQHSRHDKWQEGPHLGQILQSQWPWPRGWPSEVGRSGPCNQKLASYRYHLSKESLVFLSSRSVLENLDMFYWTRVLYGSIPIAF